MRLIVTLTASLLAGTAMAQTSTAVTSGSGGGGSSAAGSSGGDPGAGVLSTDPVAETNDAAPGLLGIDVVADRDLDMGLGDAGAAPGPITDITELPLGAGNPELGAGLDVGLTVGVDDGLDVGLDDGLDAMDDGLSGDGVDETAAVPPGDRDVDAELTDGEPTIVEADGPVVIVPADADDEDESVETTVDDDPATRLTEGVGGDVQPKMIEVEPAMQ